MSDVKLQKSSILDSTAKQLGVDPETLDEAFLVDLIFQINTALAILNQLGIGPPEGFQITGIQETWEEFLGLDPRYNMAKSYVFYKVKLGFDPAGMSSALLTSYENKLKELEFRLSIQPELP